MILASFPSPPGGVLHLGPVPIRAYALCIIAGIVAAVLVGDRRLQQRGARKGVVADIAVWAVPFGLIGARLYHLATDPELYWGAHGQGTLAALEIWKGGLGIWGAIAGGAIGAWIGARRNAVPFVVLADAVAPGLALAQAVGRWGNYFNQELFGRATSLPWAVRIDAAHAPGGVAGTFHPTFLYESLWDAGVALLVIWADRRWRLDRGRAFALYVAAYTAGRGWIEALRVDDAHRFLGLRLNDWTSIVLFVAAVTYLVVRRHPTQTPSVEDETVEDEGRSLGSQEAEI
ncbi:MAG TPA: prolipoprotein diacylglyceryl transferase [Mycobacteriales bacterium]|nr:prolipoprotein diacylglyceryl transferase [Mycobacteriales bacterium]